jgi:hypothetical protein
MRAARVLAIAAMMALLMAGMFSTGANAADNAYNIDQCVNGGVSTPQIHEACAGVNWVNGNANGSKAHWSEGQSLVYRLKLTNVTAEPHKVVIQWDITKAGLHAIDYLTS